MALLYLGYKLFDTYDIKLKKAENTTEKCISTYGKFKFEQSLLTFEISVYILTAQVFFGKKYMRLNDIYKIQSCNYNKHYQIKQIIQYGSLFAFPITTYRTFEYIKGKEQQIIDF
jgi:hypothetical protein